MQIVRYAHWGWYRTRNLLTLLARRVTKQSHIASSQKKADIKDSEKEPERWLPLPFGQLIADLDAKRPPKP
jgi:hypothetical protein